MALRTPDGRYIIVRGRLWRASNPGLCEAERAGLVHRLMAARRAIAQGRRTGDREAVCAARAEVQAAKVALGERGSVWWSDGEPDLTRRLAKTTQYADWYAGLSALAAEDEGH